MQQLQVNRQPVLDLKRLIALEGQRHVERELNVHRTTIQRWLNGQFRIPGAQLLAIRYLLGDLPGTDQEWHGWRFSRGRLTSPDGWEFTAGELAAYAFRRVNGLERVGHEIPVQPLVAAGREGRAVEVLEEGRHARTRDLRVAPEV